MPFRFVDIDHPLSSHPDFTIREMRPTLVQMFFYFFGLGMAGAICLYLVGDRMLAFPLLAVLFGLASYYAGKQVHHNRENQRATEFQNALFASALAQGCRFCLIAAKDGRIVYASPGFHTLFDAGKDGYGLEEWLTHAKAPLESKQNILDAAARGNTAELAVSLEGRDGQRHALRLAAAPIDRPKGPEVAKLS